MKDVQIQEVRRAFRTLAIPFEPSKFSTNKTPPQTRAVVAIIILLLREGASLEAIRSIMEFEKSGAFDMRATLLQAVERISHSDFCVFYGEKAAAILPYSEALLRGEGIDVRLFGKNPHATRLSALLGMVTGRAYWFEYRRIIETKGIEELSPEEFELTKKGGALIYDLLMLMREIETS